MAAYLLGTVALLAAAGAGAAACWLVLNHRVEALRAYVIASQLDRSPQRVARVEQHCAAWRSALRHWIQLHLPHWRAAA